MSDSDQIPTSLRLVRILEVLSTSSEAMTATEINARLNLPKQSIHRLCTRLIDEGYLTIAENGHGLRPTRRLRDMANGLLHSSYTHTLRHQILVQIAEKVRETVNFVVPEQSGMHYQDRVETDWPFRVQLPVGSNVPFHCTASGKTYLASLTAQKRRKFLQAIDRVQLTPNTLVGEEALLDELRKISKNGVAFDNEEFMTGMVACAVPVYDHQNRYAGSLAFHGPTQRIDLTETKAEVEILRQGAARLSQVLYGQL